MYQASIPAEDIEKDAVFLGMMPEQFVSGYLDKEEHGMNYLSKHKPCDFYRKMTTANWEIVSRTVVRNTLIQTSRKGCQAC